jgi:probable addiction module antidote protein
MKAAALKTKEKKVNVAGVERKSPRSRSHEEATVESLRKDPRFAAEYLNAVLADGDQEELMLALRYMAQALGGVPRLAQSAHLNATTLYRTLSPRGNPELRSITALLNAMGMRLAVEPLKSLSRRQSPSGTRRSLV